MSKKKIVYDQKFDNKVILAFILPVSIICIIGISIFCFSKQMYKSDMTSFLILMSTPVVLSFIALIPCIIIARYKFIIDLENGILIYRGYFKKTIQCDLSDINIKRKFICYLYGDRDCPNFKVHIFCKEKKLCIIDSSDFENKTKESLFLIFKEKMRVLNND